MKSAILLAAILFAVSASAHAQAFKCRTKDGRTYFSKSPDCIGEVPAPPARPAARAQTQSNTGAVQSPVALGESTCRSQVVSKLDLYDRGSAIIDSIVGGKLEPYEYQGSKIPARTYVMKINAKNRYGGYVGGQFVICYTSQDGARLLGVNAALAK